MCIAIVNTRYEFSGSIFPGALTSTAHSIVLKSAGLPNVPACDENIMRRTVVVLCGLCVVRCNESCRNQLRLGSTNLARANFSSVNLQ